MLNLSIKGKPLRLPTGSVQMEHVNPLLAEELQDSHSLDVEIPVDGNEEALQHVHELDLDQRITVFDGAELGHQGIPINTGILRVLSATARTITATFSAGGFVNKLRLQLPDAFAGEVIDRSAEREEGITLVDRPLYKDGGKCKFPMHLNPKLYGSANPDWYPSPGIWAADRTYNVNDLVLFTILDPGNVKREYIWQCVEAAGAGQGPATHPARWRRTAFGLVNAWNASEGEHYQNDEDGNFHAMAPWFYLKWVMQRLLNHLGYQGVGEFFYDQSTHELALPCPNTIDNAYDEDGITFFRATLSADDSAPTTIGEANWHQWRMPADLEAPLPDQDPLNLWDPTTRLATIPAAGTFRFAFRQPAPHTQNQSQTRRLHVELRNADGTLHHTVPLGVPAPFAAFPSAVVFTHSFSAPALVYITCRYTNENLAEQVLIHLWPRPGAIYAAGHYLRCHLLDEAPAASTPSDIIRVQDHVPDLPADGVLAAICDAFNLEMTPDEATRTVRFDFRETVAVEHKATNQSHRAIDPEGTRVEPSRQLRGIRLAWDIESLDIQPDQYFVNEHDTTLPRNLGEVAVVLSTRKVLQSVFDPALNAFVWEVTGYHIPAVERGDQSEAREIVPGCKPLMMEHIWLDGREYMVPVLEAEGHSARFHTFKGDRSTLWLCDLAPAKSHDGVVQDVPCARSWAFGWTPEDLSGTNLLVDHNDADRPGIYQRHHARWLDLLLHAEPVSLDLIVDPAFLVGRDWTRIMHIHGQNYLIERLPVDYDADELLLALDTPMLRLRQVPGVPKVPATFCGAPTWAVVHEIYDCDPQGSPPIAPFYTIVLTFGPGPNFPIADTFEFHSRSHDGTQWGPWKNDSDQEGPSAPHTVGDWCFAIATFGHPIQARIRIPNGCEHIIDLRPYMVSECPE